VNDRFPSGREQHFLPHYVWWTRNPMNSKIFVLLDDLTGRSPHRYRSEDGFASQGIDLWTNLLRSTTEKVQPRAGTKFQEVDTARNLIRLVFALSLFPTVKTPNNKRGVYHLIVRHLLRRTERADSEWCLNLCREGRSFCEEYGPGQ